MKKAVVATLVLFTIGIGVLLFPLPFSGHHPDYYVSRGIISPFPTTLRHVKTVKLFKPTLGDGSCVAAYSVSSADFDLLLKARLWASGFISGTFKPERYLISIWPGTPPEFESYHFIIDQMHYVDMAVSKDHTKIIFYISI